MQSLAPKWGDPVGFSSWQKNRPYDLAGWERNIRFHNNLG